MAAESSLQSKIDHLVTRIVSEVHPQQIVLFGSGAREEMAGQSDLDLLTVMPEGTHRRHTVQMLYQRLTGIDIPFDLVVTTPGDLARHKNNPGLIYRSALREGRVLYAA